MFTYLTGRARYYWRASFPGTDFWTVAIIAGTVLIAAGVLVFAAATRDW